VTWNKQPGFAAELVFWRWRAGDEVETCDWKVRPFVLEIQGNWRVAAAMWQALGCLYEQARALADGDSEAQKAALVIFKSTSCRCHSRYYRPDLEQTANRPRLTG
jgi:hypothetical protein